MKTARIGCIVVGLLSGCAAAPANRYFTLSPQDPAPPPSPRHIVVTSVRLPAALDRVQIVERTGPNSVNIREFDRWAGPLDQMVTRTLAQDLPQGGSAVPPTRIAVDIDDFMPGPAGTVRLAGTWHELPGGEARTFDLTTNIASNSGADIAAGMSRLIGMLAGRIDGG